MTKVKERKKRREPRPIRLQDHPAGKELNKLLPKKKGKKKGNDHRTRKGPMFKLYAHRDGAYEVAQFLMVRLPDGGWDLTFGFVPREEGTVEKRYWPRTFTVARDERMEVLNVFKHRDFGLLFQIQNFSGSNKTPIMPRCVEFECGHDAAVQKLSRFCTIEKAAQDDTREFRFEYDQVLGLDVFRTVPGGFGDWDPVNRYMLRQAGPTIRTGLLFMEQVRARLYGVDPVSGEPVSDPYPENEIEVQELNRLMSTLTVV